MRLLYARTLWSAPSATRCSCLGAWMRRRPYCRFHAGIICQRLLSIFDAQHQHTPGQLTNLLRVAVEDTVDPAVRQVAAITFKNLVKADWMQGGVLFRKYSTNGPCGAAGRRDHFQEPGHGRPDGERP